MRLAPIDAVVGTALDFNASVDYTTTGGGTSGYEGIAPGTIVSAAPMDGVDTGTNVPNWSGSDLMWVLNTSATLFPPGTLVHIDKNMAISTVPNTGATGRPFYVCLTNFAAGNVTTQGGWVLRRGICPVVYAVAATVGASYISATPGAATPTNPTGQKQLANMTCLIAAASAFTRTAQTQNLSTRLFLGRTNGCFIGQTLTGTGISGTITAIDPGGTFVTMSAAATATGNITATFTPTGFGICQIDNPSVMAAVS